MITNLTHIDKTDTMYPCFATLYDKKLIGDQGCFFTHEYSTVYGYVLEGTVTLPNEKIVSAGEYFSIWCWGSERVEYDGSLVVFNRIGFRGQNVIGGPLEEKGRLSYIDGCSDTMLVYPPRFGDPSLNQLFFPKHTSQTYHTHPSIRLGVVVSGFGYACLKIGADEVRCSLEKGMIFCIEEQEMHRFETIGHELTVLAFHPDGEWGPTDGDHTMLNRTYLTK